MCEICRHYPCHYMCPNYSLPKVSHFCSICNEGIYDGDQYVENNEGDCIHLDCLSQMDIYELTKWFNYEVKTMIK